MKRIFFALAVVLNCTIMMAQTEFDAFKVVQTDINGTARYMSMAGAFGALGGDPSAIKDNPAGLGIYRKSEFVGTLNLLSQSSTSKWNNADGLGDLYRFNMNNLSLVFAAPTWRNESGTQGLMSSNFSFAYNRLKNIDRSINIASGEASSSITDYMAYFTGAIPQSALMDENDPFYDISIPTISVLAYKGGLMNENTDNQGIYWTSLLGESEKVTPNFNIYEKGYVDEYSLGWAGNFSNIFYFGTTLNVQYMDYYLRSNYSESFGEGGNMNLENIVTTKGMGVNLKVGAILSPLDFLRIGLSLHTPTVYYLNDTYDATLDSYFDSENYATIPTPGDGNEYQVQSPMKISLSAAFLVGTKGLISAEYNYDSYTSTRLRNKSGDASDYSEENGRMSNSIMNNVRTIKIGGEYRLSENFSLRAGYANSNAANKPDAERIMYPTTVRTDTEYFINNRIDYLTAGFGYHESDWFVDFAYMNKIVDETYYPYKSSQLTYKANPASVITSNNNMVVTLGFKF